MDDRDHRQQAARIEQLLDDLKSMAAGPAWARIEELVTRLVQLYGAGLQRWAEHLRAAGALDDALAARLAGDDLLASLLLLHGVHPWPVERRVEQALERARPQLQAQLGEVTLLAVDLAGAAARVRVAGSERGELAERLVLRAIGDAAPELARVEVEGAPPRPSRELVQIGLPRPRPEASR